MKRDSYWGKSDEDRIAEVSRLIDTDTCALCGTNERPVIVIEDERRTYLSACGLCLATAFDELTGYHFVKLYHHYENLKAFHAEQKKLRGGGQTHPRKGQTFAEVLSAKLDNRKA